MVHGIGTSESKGTKVFSVSGDVARPGVYELELGSTLFGASGPGRRTGREDGAGGWCSGPNDPASRMGVPLSFETVLGSGAVMVYNQTRDVIDIVHRTMKFFASESCGKCAPCREGTEVMVEITERLSKAEGTVDDIAVLTDLSTAMSLASLCGLGQAAPLVVQDTLTHFRSDYETRVEQSRFLRTVRGR